MGMAVVIGFGLALICALLAIFILRPSAAGESVGDPTHPQAAVGASPGMARAGANRSSSEKTRERLIHAGLYRQSSPGVFYLTQFVFAIVPLLAGAGAYSMGLIGFRLALLLGLVTGIAGVVLPGLWLDYRKAKRQTAMRRSIPDALDVITICVEAGLSLGAALVRVSKELASTHPLLASELTIAHRQVQMGKSTGESLRSLAERFDLEELRSLASVVQQSEKFGASIANALRVHGDSLRVRRMQKAQEKAQKASVKVLFPTLLCIFPALFVVVLGPAAYDIVELINRVTGR